MIRAVVGLANHNPADAHAYFYGMAGRRARIFKDPKMPEVDVVVLHEWSKASGAWVIGAPAIDATNKLSGHIIQAHYNYGWFGGELWETSQEDWDDILKRRPRG